VKKEMYEKVVPDQIWEHIPARKLRVLSVDGSKVMIQNVEHPEWEPVTINYRTLQRFYRIVQQPLPVPNVLPFIKR